MQKIILSLILAIVFFFTGISSCYADVSIVSPVNGSSVISQKIDFKWENTDKGNAFCYIVEIGPPLDYSIYSRWYPQVGLESTMNTFASYTPTVEWNGEIDWWIQYGKKDNDGNCKITDGTLVFKFFYNPQTEVKVNEGRNEISTPQVKQSVQTTKAENLEDTLVWNIDTMDTPAVLGIEDDELCRYKYIKGRNKAGRISCDFPRVTVKKSSLDDNRIYVEGSYSQPFKIYIDNYHCERKVLDPSTWFGCKEVYDSTDAIEVPVNYIFNIKDDHSNYSIDYFKSSTGNYVLSANISQAQDNFRLEYVYSLNSPSYQIDVKGNGSLVLKPEKEIVNTNKPFVFPLEQISGVTQWHGNTDYQKPHTGIDFGTTSQSIVAVSNGIIVGKGWDNYNGTCFSGGNYLLVQQTNGMYTVYFHLKSISKDVGAKVSQGERLGVSGNTGSWNCQPLNYHLHFETRLNRNQSSHVDPVQYIAVDWNKVVTLNTKANPGRLSGDNPHPAY